MEKGNLEQRLAAAVSAHVLEEVQEIIAEHGPGEVTLILTSEALGRATDVLRSIHEMFHPEDMGELERFRKFGCH